MVIQKVVLGLKTKEGLTGVNWNCEPPGEPLGAVAPTIPLTVVVPGSPVPLSERIRSTNSLEVSVAGPKTMVTELIVEGLLPVVKDQPPRFELVTVPEEVAVSPRLDSTTEAEVEVAAKPMATKGKIAQTFRRSFQEDGLQFMRQRFCRL